MASNVEMVTVPKWALDELGGFYFSGYRLGSARGLFPNSEENIELITELAGITGKQIPDWLQETIDQYHVDSKTVEVTVGDLREAVQYGRCEKMLRVLEAADRGSSGGPID